MSSESRTRSERPASQERFYPNLIASGATSLESVVDQPVVYTRTVSAPLKTESIKNNGRFGLLNSPSARQVPQVETIARIKGVVDEVGVATSKVTLSYDNRENTFLMPTTLLRNAGASYIGALLEIRVENYGGSYDFRLTHLVEEENRIRAEAGEPDLSFLP